jgi:predicted choloylglycine hydrolase
MHIPAVQHTLYIFERMHDHLPPLIPSEILELFEKRLEGVRNQHDIALEEVEQIMAEVGKKIWPYMRAFEDVHKHYTDKLGQELLHQRASTGLKRKLQIFKEMGGTYQDVYRGSGSDFLGVGERQEHDNLKQDIYSHVNSFDHGFSLLGPRVDINEVKNLKGYYQGKKDEKKIL